MALLVSSKVFGKRKPLLDDFSVPPPELPGDGGDDYRLRDLIDHIVRHKVAQFKKRQSERRFDRVLSPSQIEADAAKGKVDPAAEDYDQELDVEEAIAVALQGFEDGLYLVILDEVERRSLDEIVFVQPDSRLVFIRLTFLAGF